MITNVTNQASFGPSVHGQLRASSQPARCFTVATMVG